MSITQSRSPGGARKYWPVVKLILLAVVLVFISRRAIQLWNSTPQQSISVNVVWLCPAALAYFAGWLPSVWLWLAFMRTQGQFVDWRTGIRAYYVSHLGKYVPGKALALVIRGAMIEGTGASPLVAAITGGFETIVYMATGTALFLALSPLVFSPASAFGQGVLWSWCREQPTVFALTVIAVTFATTPFSAWFFTRLCRRAATGAVQSTHVATSIPATLVCKGVCTTAIGWIFHALSLGFVVQSVSGDSFDLARFPTWLAACTLSMVGGFIVLIAPGGVGVREGLLIEVLKDQPEIGPAKAIVVAALLRATWFVTELAAAGILYIAPKVFPAFHPKSGPIPHTED